MSEPIEAACDAFAAVWGELPPHCALAYADALRDAIAAYEAAQWRPAAGIAAGAARLILIENEAGVVVAWHTMAGCAPYNAVRFREMPTLPSKSRRTPRTFKWGWLPIAPR